MVKIQTFPTNMSELKIDKDNMRKCLVEGLYREDVEIGGYLRNFYTYITPGLEYNKPCLIIAPPDNIPINEFIENGFWEEFAEHERVFLFFLEPIKEWNFDGTDADYMNKVYVQIQSRKYYVTMQDNIYALGFGKGAVIAQQATMKMTSEWAGLATFGNLDKEALLNADIIQVDEDMGKTELTISASKVQLPVWMLWEQESDVNRQVCQYWKKQNDVTNEIFYDKMADEIYFPSTICKKSSINEEKIAQVRITKHYDGILTEELFMNVWKFIGKARRHRCHGTKVLRWYKNPLEYGAEVHKIQLAGFTRIWYEYVPEKVKKIGKPSPLVINMHGRGGSAETFMDMSQMNCVAEERDFIVLFPEASIHQQRVNGVRNVLLWDGEYEGEKIDDTAFILAMIEDVKKRYPIDEKRIYACGQSSGGMMTSELALNAPQIFAAVSPWSAIMSPDHHVELPKKIEPAVPYLFLFGENDWLCVDKEKGQMEYNVASDIAEFLKNIIRIYELDQVPKCYQCGEINYYVYFNRKQTPMLIVGTQFLPVSHTKKTCYDLCMARIFIVEYNYEVK